MYYHFDSYHQANMLLLAYPNAKIVSTEYNTSKPVRINIFLPVQTARNT